MNILDIAFLEDGRVLLFGEGNMSAIILLDDTACPETKNSLLIQHRRAISNRYSSTLSKRFDLLGLTSSPPPPHRPPILHPSPQNPDK